MESPSCAAWAFKTFGGVRAGDVRRARRLVAMGARLAERAAGTVTGAFEDRAEREGAYRLLSNEALSVEALVEGVGVSTAKACAKQSTVYVAIDGSTLSLTDRTGRRGVGGVGAWKDRGRGVHVMSALALDARGVAVGLCDQRYWIRTEARRSSRTVGLKTAEKETRFAIEAIERTCARMRTHCPETKAVLVMDRGFDCWPLLQKARSGECAFILRAQYSRRLATSDKTRSYLREVLEAQPACGCAVVRVPARNGQPARVARMTVRTARVTLELRIARKQRDAVTLNAVLVEEIRGPKEGALSWMLLTTEPVETLGCALAVVHAYTLRWRIEDMHRVWKRGAGNVEDTQLRSLGAIAKWATLHAAVATRAQRLTQLARTEPEAPALDEFSEAEIDATLLLRRKALAKKPLARPFTLAQIVRLIADEGGYTGASSGGPPGATVIARGLERVLIAAEVIETLKK